MGSSSIILNNGSMILFKHNTVSGQGGAIYADICTLGQTGYCVVKHSNPALHPDDWEVNITFIDNRLTSGQANAIYVDSIQSFENSFNDTFCWNGWFYMNSSWFPENCISQLRSIPTYINYAGPFNYTIYRWDSLQYVIQLTVHDIWDNDITDPDKILVEFINGPAYTYTYSYKDIHQPSTLSSPILVDCSSQSTNQSSLLYVHPFHFPGFAVTIHFKQCGDQYCRCSIPFHDYVTCWRGDFCQSPGRHGACPSAYYICNDYFNHSCAEGREGILCGNCSAGYAVAINDPDLSCTQCNYQYGVAIFLQVNQKSFINMEWLYSYYYN